MSQKIRTAQKNKKLISKTGITSKNKSPTEFVAIESTQVEVKKFNANVDNKRQTPEINKRICFFDLKITFHSESGSDVNVEVVTNLVPIPYVSILGLPLLH